MEFDLEGTANNRTYNICESKTERVESERTCRGWNWKCRYGICKLKNIKSSNIPEPYCECDPGAIGEICQNKCCRSCHYGNCSYIKEDDREICKCDLNYTGAYCETRVPPSSE